VRGAGLRTVAAADGTSYTRVVMITEYAIRALPKVELHRHLDGSVRIATLLDLARRGRLDLGARTAAALAPLATVTAPLDDLAAVLDRFSLLQKALFDAEAISRVACENVEDAWRDGVVAAELRFAPAFIAAGKSLTAGEIVAAVVDGARRAAQRFPVEVALIGILPRSAPLEANQAATRALLDCRASGRPGTELIRGFDLADQEDVHDPLPLVPLVDAAREAGLGITIHSGENTGPEWVRRTLELFRPQRIGHGIRAWGDPGLVAMLGERDVLLEVCPTSNWLTRSVPSLEEHPLPFLLRAGVPVSLNSDDPHLMAIDLVHEYALCARLFGFGLEEFAAMNRAALAHSFLAPEAKRRAGERLGA
jgi:adenosine deaminase